MPHKDIRTISDSILGKSSPPTYQKKVLFVMYYSELLALNFVEIEAIFKKNGRERIFNIFYLEQKFVEHIYSRYLNSELDSIMSEIYHRLVKTQELLHQRELLKTCKTTKFAQ